MTLEQKKEYAELLNGKLESTKERFTNLENEFEKCFCDILAEYYKDNCGLDSEYSITCAICGSDYVEIRCNKGDTTLWDIDVYFRSYKRGLNKDYGISLNVGSRGSFDADSVYVNWYRLVSRLADNLKTIEDATFAIPCFDNLKEAQDEYNKIKNSYECLIGEIEVEEYEIKKNQFLTRFAEGVKFISKYYKQRYLNGEDYLVKEIGKITKKCINVPYDGRRYDKDEFVRDFINGNFYLVEDLEKPVDKISKI